MGNAGMHLKSLREAIEAGFTPQWMALGEGDCLIQQKGRGSIQRVVVCNGDAMWYDQWLVCEPVGAATAPIKQGKLGMVQVWRPISSLENPVDPYKPNLDDLGRISLEIPRGLPVGIETPAQTALREGEEEAQTRLVKPYKLGPYYWNTTFCANGVPLYTARVVPGKPIESDPNEKILKADFFSAEEVGKMVDRGEIVDGFTLAALTYLGRQLIFSIF